MIKNNNIDEYNDLIDSKIPKSTEQYYINFVKRLHDFYALYNEYIEIDKQIFQIGRDIGFKKRELEKLNNELKTLYKEIDINLSSLVYGEDNKLNYDFNLWIKSNEDIKKQIDNLEKKISFLEKDIDNITIEEDKLIVLKNELKPKLNYLIILINNEKGKEKYYNNNINLKDLVKIKSLVYKKEDKLLLEKYFIINVRLKNLIFNNISKIINDLNIDKDINEEIIYIIKIMMLSLKGMDDSEEIDLDIMINNPIFKDKLSILTLIFNYLNNNELNSDDLKKYEHIKIINDKNMWFLNLVDLLNKNNKNNKSR